MSTVIEDVTARKVFNSRGQETIEVDILTTAGFGRAAAPAGASTGRAEAVSYPEGGVTQAVRKVEDEIAPELIGLDAEEQETVDRILREIDGTKDFRNIGGNTACAVSIAAAEAAASSIGIPLFQHLAGVLAYKLPHPLGNVLGGGKHAKGKSPDIQEFLALPVEAKTFFEAAKANVTVHQKISALLRKVDATFTGGKSDEGAWAPNMKNEEALGIVVKACEETSQELGVKCRAGLDVAASSLWDGKKGCYVYVNEGVSRDAGEQLEFVLRLIRDYKLVYLEDAVHEDDFEGFVELTKKAKGCLICGDDLFVTNVERLSKGIKVGAGNAIIIKINQVGTLTDAWRTTEMAKAAQYVPVMSHRSGETASPYLAHLAVAFRCPIIKTGVVGGERTAKINELIRIEELLEARGEMAGLSL